MVTRRELVDAGFTAREVERMVERGSLIPVYRGVYRVGHAAPCGEASYMAAVKACGEGAWLCGRAAGWVLEIVRGDPPAPEVITPKHRHVRGLRTRTGRREGGVCRRIRVTTPAETFVDLASVLSSDELARSFDRAHTKHGLTPDEVEQVLARRPNARGAASARAVASGEVKLVLSELERRARVGLEQLGIEFEMNAPAGTKSVDIRIPSLKLTIELDSYRFHNTRHAWLEDRRREREARARGDELLRYPWEDVDAMVAEVMKKTCK